MEEASPVQAVAAMKAGSRLSIPTVEGLGALCTAALLTSWQVKCQPPRAVQLAGAVSSRQIKDAQRLCINHCCPAVNRR